MDYRLCCSHLSLRSYESAVGSSLKSQTDTSGISPIIGLLIKRAQRNRAEYLLPGRKKENVAKGEWAYIGVKPWLHWSCAFQFLGDLDFIRRLLCSSTTAATSEELREVWGGHAGDRPVSYSPTSHQPSTVQGRDKGLAIEDYLFCEKISFSCTGQLYWATSLHQPQKAQAKVLKWINRRC